MDYVVTAGLRPPVDISKLDPLQQEGVVSVLDHQLGRVEGVAGPEEEDIDVLDYRIEVGPDGATVMLAVDAPALSAAENAAANVVREILLDSQVLEHWTLTHSEVKITEDEFNESLAAAEQHTGERLGEADERLQAEIEEAFEQAELPESDPLRGEAVSEERTSDSRAGTAETESWRIRLHELSERLRAFSEDAFGESGTNGQQAKLAAGALIHAVSVVTDELFYDELALTVNDATADSAVGLLVLEELPPCYQHNYDARFTRSLLLCSAAVATRLTGTRWQPPRCVAEALALRLFVNEARVVLEATELMSWDESAPLFDSFAAHACPDNAYEELFAVGTAAAEGVESSEEAVTSEAVEQRLRTRGLAFEQWFNKREETNTATGQHPYLG
ncbi:hypothetical protein CDG81_16480 [Actinopolyspora erythraea]|uniref:Uncharacterized protein n=1 Tax=Actinopolyspora erythraea TaxID=414996 RepID=A0A099D0N0_9ACTN|nr:hypothetical protein [Actinopolyspora erythraea]ASU79599.1 hypothetical protein CDG81_16480 [Actinopolyspora erythraea]KGI79481.1 hypothetical protein IL38_23650 [Actinopolyspora erythraea]